MNVFEAAIDKINTYGWTQNAYLRTDEYRPGMCIRGACLDIYCDLQCRTIGLSGLDLSYEETLIRVLEEQYPGMGFYDVTTWNDQPERRVEEVIALLEKASARLEEGRFVEPI